VRRWRAWLKLPARRVACPESGVEPICGMEGPQFSTKAESSNVYRGLGMDVIGMTNLQESESWRVERSFAMSPSRW